MQKYEHIFYGKANGFEDAFKFIQDYEYALHTAIMERKFVTPIKQPNEQ